MMNRVSGGGKSTASSTASRGPGFLHRRTVHDPSAMHGGQSGCTLTLPPFPSSLPPSHTFTDIIPHSRHLSFGHAGYGTGAYYRDSATGNVSLPGRSNLSGRWPPCVYTHSIYLIWPVFFELLLRSRSCFCAHVFTSTISAICVCLTQHQVVIWLCDRWWYLSKYSPLIWWRQCNDLHSDT